MIFDIYLILLVMSLCLIALGLYANNPALSIVGGGILFVCGGVLVFDTLQYKDGLTIDTTANPSIVTYTYGDYSSKGVGTVIMLLGFAGIFLTLMDQWRASR